MNNRTDKKQDWQAAESTVSKSSQGRDPSIPETDKKSGQRAPSTTPEATNARVPDSAKNRDQNSRR